LILRCGDGQFLRVRFRYKQHSALRADLGAGATFATALHHDVREPVLHRYGLSWTGLDTDSAPGTAITINLNHSIFTSILYPHLAVLARSRPSNDISRDTSGITSLFCLLAASR
jgi:hypothetical protein